MSNNIKPPIISSKYRAFLGKANAYIEYNNENNICPTPEQARVGLDTISVFYLNKMEVSCVIDAVVSLPDRNIPVRIYDPQPEQDKAVTVYMHGGGHMCGSVNLYDAVTRRLAACTGQLVVSIDYRLAPEYPYPCGLEDCQAVVDHLESLLVDYRVKLNQITLAGDSAGGALASGVAWRAERDQIHRLVLIYPSLDYTFSTPSYETFASGYLLETERIEWYFDQYFESAADRKIASPLFFPSLNHMPKTLILAAELDPLVDEGRLFHQRLIRSGIDSDYYENKGAIHCFLNLESLNTELIDETYEMISAFVNS